MKNIIYIIALAFGYSYSPVLAQVAEESKIEFSGSVDTYYKYDFSGTSNIGTSFASDHNSISLGMVNFIATKEVGKASFVADLSFGPRGGSESLPSEGVNIQNLYISYSLTDAISITGGYMGTFVGYEVISPVANFNYSTSYLFTSGPFQNAGIKADIAITEKVGLMVGVFNDWNIYSQQQSNGNPNLNSVGAQLSVSPLNGWDVYINFLTGENDGTIYDLTTSYQLNNNSSFGLNAATYTNGESGASEYTFGGAALYLNYSVSESIGLGMRAENFSSSSGGVSASVTGITVSANLLSGPLKLIPEIRFDSASDPIFAEGPGLGAVTTNTATQLVLAVVYEF